MAKRTTKTKVVTKAMARSGPELTPSQIRLDDSVQTDNEKVFTQSDLNQSMSSGGGGGGGIAPDLKDYAKTEYVDSADNALNDLIAANTKAIEEIDIPAGIAPDLDDYATTEYVDGGDAVLDKKIAAVAKDLDVIENDYTTTDEFNLLNSKVSQNKKDIASLGDAFDTAVAAAQDGAENLEIELQSYAKKEDIPPSPDLTEYAKKEDIPEGADLTEYAKTEYVDNEIAKIAPPKEFPDTSQGDLERAESGDLMLSWFYSVRASYIDTGNWYQSNARISLAFPDELHGNYEAGFPLNRATHIVIPGKNPVLNTQTSDQLWHDEDYSKTLTAGNFVRLVYTSKGVTQFPSEKIDMIVTLGDYVKKARLNNVDHYIFEVQSISANIEAVHAYADPLNERYKDPDNHLYINTRANDGVYVTPEKLEETLNDFVPAPRLPGFTWEFKDYPEARNAEEGVSEQGSAAVTPGEFTWNSENSTFYISCTSACGILLGNQQSSFSAYTIPAVMTIYDQAMGLCAFIKVSSVQIQSYAGQHYFRIVRSGYAKQVLSAGKTYNITLSGVF